MWFNKKIDEQLSDIRAKMLLEQNILGVWQSEIEQSIKQLTEANTRLFSAVAELKTQLSLSDSSALRKQLDELLIWKAGLMAELVKETPMGQKKKTKLWSKLRG